MCITTYIDGHCGNGAADLYIDAVNVEHPDEVADTHDVCVACAYNRKFAPTVSMLSNHNQALKAYMYMNLKYRIYV